MQAQANALAYLLTERFHEKAGGVAEQECTIAHTEIYVFISVHVPDSGASCSLHGDRIDEFFQAQAEIGCCSTVSQEGPKSLHLPLGVLRALCEPLNQGR